MTVAMKTRASDHYGRTTMSLAGTATVQDLLRARAELPTDDPRRATLRERSIEAGLPLARHLANKYRGRGEPLEDLQQVAAVALCKAVDAFDPARQVTFSSFATPCILGAIKRHFRDHTWRVRVPRAIQELAVRLSPARAELTQELGRAPTLQELAVRLDAAEKDVAVAGDAWRAHRPDSLDALVAGGPEQPRPLIDTLGALDARFDTVTDLHTVKLLVAGLSDRQRRILALRYFGGLTQTEIAAEVGLSQMHVSRLLERTLTQLRTGMLAERSLVPPAGRPYRSSPLRPARLAPDQRPAPEPPRVVDRISQAL